METKYEPNKWNGYTITAWREPDYSNREPNYSYKEDPEYLEDMDLFEKSFICYLELFNQLPLKGMDITNSVSDIAKIIDITFCGIDKQIHFDVKDINDI